MNRTRAKQIAHYTAKDTPPHDQNRVARLRRKFYNRSTAKQRAELRAEMKYELTN